MSGHHHQDRVSTRVGCAVVTISDSRSEDDDRSGPVLRELLEAAGHPVREHRIVPDERGAIRAAVEALVARPDVAAVLLTGGTGIAARDVTIESLAGLWTKELPGFGELFRSLSFEEVGAASMLSRAVAGIVAGVFVAALPGSPKACRLALERLIVPQLGHIAGLLGRGT
jgi:molybdenum cofactor biosynthesis protein B